MKHSFLRKFFAVNSLVFVSSFMLIVILLSVFISNYITKDKKTTLYQHCTTIGTLSYEYNNLIGTDEDSRNLFYAITKFTDVDIFITTLKGDVVVCSCDDWLIDGFCEHNKKPISSQIINSITDNTFSQTGDLNGHFSQVKFTHAALLQNHNGEGVGFVFASVNSTHIRAFFNTIFRLFLISSLVAMIFMFFAEYYISYKFTKPLRLMVEASRSMANGDFSKRIPVTGNDEIGELAIAFNQMTNSLVQLEGTSRHFVANISHEFKTPMTTIGGFIDGIIDGTIPKEKQEEYLKIVSNEIKRLSRLVQSMLSLSKLESGELQINRSEFDLFDMIINILLSQEQRIEKSSLNIEGLENISSITVNADYDLIYQVVYNLIDNAIKFTNENGTINFEVNNFNNLIQFKIRNTGEGIKEKDMPFVFDRFYKTDKSRSAVKDSTGLGLHLANAIISIHGGKISVKSEINKFTEFSFVLPNSN